MVRLQSEVEYGHEFLGASPMLAWRRRRSADVRSATGTDGLCGLKCVAQAEPAGPGCQHPTGFSIAEPPCRQRGQQKALAKKRSAERRQENGEKRRLEQSRARMSTDVVAAHPQDSVPGRWRIRRHRPPAGRLRLKSAGAGRAGACRAGATGCRHGLRPRRPRSGGPRCANAPGGHPVIGSQRNLPSRVLCCSMRHER